MFVQGLSVGAVKSGTDILQKRSEDAHYKGVKNLRFVTRRM